ncbi:hypothetical protein AX15_006959 [Amanita polypyramis BW_CC]|nr:hypothetical protein AX15_006959 [Amanita polypyramis BW_CC]
MKVSPAVTPIKRRAPDDPRTSTQHIESKTYTLIKDFFYKKVPEITVEGKYRVREPAKFDLHLDKKLILEKVRHAPNIADDLLTIATKGLEQLEHEGTLPSEKGISYEILLRTISPPNTDSGMVDYYAKNIANSCAMISATLLLRLPNWKAAALLEYSQDVSGQSYAITDGYLCLKPDSLDLPTKWDLQNQTQTMLKETNKRFPRLATWAFKRLGSKVNEKKIMREVLRLSNLDKFPWTSCRGDKCLDLSHTGSPPVTGPLRGRGVDAETVRLVEALYFDDDQHMKTKEVDTRSAKYMLQQAWAQSVENDTTFLIIKSPNYEIIGYRDRDHQTLHLSDLIHVPTFKDGYMRLQIGLYMAVLQDAIERCELGRQLEPPKVKYDSPRAQKTEVKKPKNERERMVRLKPNPSRLLQASSNTGQLRPISKPSKKR